MYTPLEDSPLAIEQNAQTIDLSPAWLTILEREAARYGSIGPEHTLNFQQLQEAE